eukprot:363545-Chlamydomonas_euryale.AAC.13
MCGHEAGGCCKCGHEAGGAGCCGEPLSPPPSAPAAPRAWPQHRQHAPLQGSMHMHAHMYDRAAPVGDASKGSKQQAEKGGPA